MHSLDAIFKPRSIAVIGATPRVGSIGREILNNLFANEFNGKIFPVNPKYEYIHSTKAYPSVASIPDAVDLAVIVVPAAHVLGAVEECAQDAGPTAPDANYDGQQQNRPDHPMSDNLHHRHVLHRLEVDGIETPSEKGPKGIKRAGAAPLDRSTPGRNPGGGGFTDHCRLNNSWSWRQDHNDGPAHPSPSGDCGLVCVCRRF